MAFRRQQKEGERWAIITSLIKTCKLFELEPYAYLAGVITKIVNGHPNRCISDLLPWVCHTTSVRELVT